MIQTFIFLLLSFLLVIFSTLLYFKNKTARKESFARGVCPSCGAEPIAIEDSIKGTKVTKKPIKSKVLKNHGCSGVIEIEYNCSNCGVKEVHTHQNGGCSF